MREWWLWNFGSGANTLEDANGKLGGRPGSGIAAATHLDYSRQSRPGHNHGPRVYDFYTPRLWNEPGVKKIVLPGIMLGLPENLPALRELQEILRGLPIMPGRRKLRRRPPMPACSA